MNCIVIGGGPGGYVAAISAAKKGASVTLVEKGYLGGTCLNRGCIPTKAILHSAHAYHHALNSFPGIGINLEGVSLDFGAVMKNKDKVVAKLRGGVDYLLKKNGVKVIAGEAEFIDSRNIRVRTGSGDVSLSAEAFIIATGSSPISLPFAQFDGARVLSSDHILEIDRLPSSLAIIGGGVVGCEFAQAFARMGVKVGIVEMLPRLIANMDPEQSSLMERVLKRDKIDLYLQHGVTGVEVSEAGVRLSFKDPGGAVKELEAEKLLVAVGRAPNTAALGLANAGVRRSTNGFIEVDDGMHTNVPGIYAIGDVTGKMQLAHVASHQGIVAAANMLGGHDEMDYSAVPQCIYTEPEIASIGQTETSSDVSLVRKGMFPASANGRSMIEGVTDGFSKVLVDRDSLTVLGLHLAGAGVTEMVSHMTGLIQWEVTLEDLHSRIYAHPSISEMVQESFLDAEGMAIHI